MLKIMVKTWKKSNCVVDKLTAYIADGHESNSTRNTLNTVGAMELERRRRKMHLFGTNIT
jgi:hypothetical protein